MNTKRTFYLAAALIVAIATVLLFSLSSEKRVAYPLSVTFVEWTDTLAPPTEMAAQAEQAGLHFSTLKGNWAHLAITNNGTKPLRFDSRVVEYESDGSWVQDPATGWPGVHGKVWWPGSGSIISVPRPSQVPATARWRFQFTCALDPVGGVRRMANQAAGKLLGKDTFIFCAPSLMVSPEIPQREPNQPKQRTDANRSAQEANRISSAATNNSTGSPRPADEIIPAGRIKFINAELSQVLEFYAALSEAQLDSTQLGKLQPLLISFENKKDVTRSEALLLFDTAFHDQAGIVVTHPDRKHAVFRFRSARNEK